MIEVEHLTFEYPTVRALRDVSFTVPPATITALVGPNGSGKTTLLRCLAALERPFAGRVRVNGLDTQEEPRGVHRNLGYLSDFFGLYDDLTVSQCLTFMARIHGAPDSRVEKTADRIGLGDYLDRTPKELSRGLRQRLAIGQAILHEPRVVLLDEPASGLDPGARIALGQLFVELGEGGMTLVVSSHILAELEAYATDILILKEGRILEHRSVARPVHRQRLQLELLEFDPRLEAVLSRRPEVDDLEVVDREARFELSGDREARHRLLADLLGQGFAVCGLAPVKVSLQETYLSRIEPGAEG